MRRGHISSYIILADTPALRALYSIYASVDAFQTFTNRPFPDIPFDRIRKDSRPNSNRTHLNQGVGVHMYQSKNQQYATVRLSVIQTLLEVLSVFFALSVLHP